MFGIRFGVLMVAVVTLAGAAAISGFLHLGSELRKLEAALSTLQTEHAELVSRYQTLQLENDELKVVLAKRGNIRNLYAR